MVHHAESHLLFCISRIRDHISGLEVDTVVAINSPAGSGARQRTICISLDGKQRVQLRPVAESNQIILNLLVEHGILPDLKIVMNLQNVDFLEAKRQPTSVTPDVGLEPTTFR